MKLKELKKVNQQIKRGSAPCVTMPKGMIRFLLDHAETSALTDGNQEERETMRELLRLRRRGFFDD